MVVSWRLLQTANAQPGTRYWCRPTFVFSDRSVTISVLGVEREILFLNLDATAGHPVNSVSIHARQGGFVASNRPRMSSFNALRTEMERCCVVTVQLTPDGLCDHRNPFIFPLLAHPG